MVRSTKTVVVEQVNYYGLFYLHDPLANRPLRLSPQQDWLHSKEASLLFHGGWQPPEPVVLRARRGGSPADFLWSGLTPLVCVSARVVNLLLDNRFTGWATYPVAVYGRKGEPLDGYYGFAIKSFVGEQDLARSQVIIKYSSGPSHKPIEYYKGIYFDERRWDGSDIFRIGHARVAATVQLRQAFRKAKISNVLFTPLSEVEILAAVFRYARPEKQDNEKTQA